MTHNTTPATKICSKCKQEKPLDEYSRHRRTADGLQARCKACFSAWYAANRERELERMRVWREANREHHAELRHAWWQANPEKRAKYAKRHSAKHPDRIKARQAILGAVYRGKMSPARDFICVVCGAPAAHYHHHRGYAPEHKFDVVPVCVTCHTELHKDN